MQDEIIDENFVVSHKLQPSLVDWKTKYVLKKYGEKISEKLFKEGSYFISNEKFAGQDRVLTILRIRRDESIPSPNLLLTIEAKNGKMRNKKLFISTDRLLQEKLQAYPVAQRYKFPKV